MAQPLPVFRSDATGHRLAQRPQPSYLEAERPRPVNGSQREGCKRLLAKVNGVDAQVQQEAPPSLFFLADSLAAVPQAESSLPSLSLKVNELLPFREGKEALCVNIGLADERGVEIPAAGIDVGQQPAVAVVSQRGPFFFFGCFVAVPFFNRPAVPTTCSLTTCSLTT